MPYCRLCVLLPLLLPLLVLTVLLQMIYISWELSLVMLLVIPPISIFAVLYGKFVRALSKSVQVTMPLCVTALCVLYGVLYCVCACCCPCAAGDPL